MSDSLRADIFNHSINPEHNAFVYPYEGQVEIGPANQMRLLETQSAGVLSTGDDIEIQAGSRDAAFLLLAARPLREPIRSVRALCDECTRRDRAGYS